MLIDRCIAIMQISIRTPAWGVTLAFCSNVVDFKISIRTPAWGVTPLRPSAYRAGNFNSHPRVGGDKCGYSSWGCNNDFNSHPRVGGDPLAQVAAHAPFHFNSHPRVGGDLYGLGFLMEGAHFNSHPRVGGDGKVSQENYVELFQFAPPRGG